MSDWAEFNQCQAILKQLYQEQVTINVEMHTKYLPSCVLRMEDPICGTQC